MFEKMIMLLVLVFVSGCAHSSDKSSSVMFDDLANNAGAMEGKRLFFSGFLRPVSGGFFLYKSDSDAQREDFSAGLDVVMSRNVREPKSSDVGDGRCAVIDGVFTAFDDDTVGTGYFRSTVGFVEARKITLQDCDQAGRR